MIEATTDAMCLSSHGGLLVLRQEEEHLALASQLSSCIHDSRTPYLVRHSLTEILMTRIFQICLGKNAILHHKITRVKYFSAKNRQVKRSMKYSG